MKVNPIGIQSYQQLTNRQSQATQRLNEQQPDAIADKKVTISPQQEAAVSKIAVKSNGGNYSDYLSPEEKNALDILFSRFKDSERFGNSFNSDTQVATRQKTLGTNIDLKV